MMERATRQRDYFLSAPQVEQRSDAIKSGSIFGSLPKVKATSLSEYRVWLAPVSWLEALEDVFG